MRRSSLAWFVIFFLAIGFAAEAQVSRKKVRKNNKRISGFRGQKNYFGKDKIYSAIGVSINSLNYYGDVAPRSGRVSTDISFTRPGIGLSFSERIAPRITLQSQFMYGVLKGADSESADKNDLNSGIYRYKRNLSFRNQVMELSMVGVVDLFDNRFNYISRVKWTPYAYLGLAGLTNNPKAIAPNTDLHGNPLPEAGQWVKLRPLGTEGQHSTLESTDANFGTKQYSPVQIAVPFGIGARLRLTETLDLWFDIGLRWTFTDYLDDVSQNYVDLGVFSNELARAMSYRTGELNLDPSNEVSYVGRDGVTYTVENGYGSEYPDNRRGGKNDNDIYMVTTFRLTHILGATFHRAKFR